MQNSIDTFQLSKSYDFSFEKYHGLSNDFIFISSQTLLNFHSAQELQSFTKYICRRGSSIGADGVVFYDSCSSTCSVSMLIINSDGSFAGNCGNALRCLGLLFYRQGVWDGKDALRVFRLALPESIAHSLLDDDLYLVKDKYPIALITSLVENKNYVADVTTLFSLPKLIISKTDSFIDIQNKLKIKLFPIFVQLENPHLVFFSKVFSQYSYDDFCKLGQLIQKRLNANISMIYESDKLNRSFNLYVYERGAGLTKACGTGAVASALALKFAQLVGSLTEPLYINMLGGQVCVQSIYINESLTEDEKKSSYEKIGLTAAAEFIFSARMRVASA